MTISSGDCCNPTAKNDMERCLGCPMRKKAMVVQEGTTAKSDQNAPQKTTQPVPPPQRRMSAWQIMHDELPTD